MPQLSRTVCARVPHHITQRGNRREAVFFSDDDRTVYLNWLKEYAERYAVDIFAYCLKGKTPYHTIAYVDAEYFLRNDYNVSKYRIPIMIESGPNYTRVPDDTLGLGNHVLLFLSSSSLINFAHHFLQDYYNQLINDSTVRFRISGGGKYLLKPGEQCPVEWEDEIKQVVKMRPRVPVTNE